MKINYRKINNLIISDLRADRDLLLSGMKKNIFSILFAFIFVFTGFSAYADEPIDQNPTPEAPVVVENILIRDGDSVIYEGTFPLPNEGTVDIIDNTGGVHSVNNRSVLGVLYLLDQNESSFSLSNLQYYESFSSLYLKCVNSDLKGESCDNWQYVVGNTSPWTSIDTTMLSGGESIGLYFGSPYKLELSNDSTTTNGNINVYAKSYNYLDNTWVARSGISVGITQVNPDDAWNPIIISTNPVDALGFVSLSFSIPGSYNIGVSEDYYFPSYAVSISEPGSSSGSSYVTPPEVVFSKDTAIGFLNSNKKSDGSFGSMLYTDWAAIAAKSIEDKNLIESISAYLTSNTFSSSVITDNERHALALMSVGINPYNGTSVDYIKKITDSFDGIQIGDRNLDNDDIFGLLVLKKAGYNYNDEIISNTIDFIKSKQSGDGSWDSSVDMTAASVMSLYPFKNKDGVGESVDRAFGYLISSQSNDGSFANNPSSTSWVIQALSLKSDYESAVKKAMGYLAKEQKIDGGIGDTGLDLDSRVWATSYAISASSLKSWIDIVPDFEKINREASGDKVEEKKIDTPIAMVEKKEIPENLLTVNEVVNNTNENNNKKVVKLKTAVANKNTPTVLPEENKENNALVANASSAAVQPQIPLFFKVIFHFISSFFASMLNYFK